jgi:hypothetical protein
MCTQVFGLARGPFADHFIELLQQFLFIIIRKAFENDLSLIALPLQYTATDTNDLAELRIDTGAGIERFITLSFIVFCQRCRFGIPELLPPIRQGSIAGELRSRFNIKKEDIIYRISDHKANDALKIVQQKEKTAVVFGIIPVF